MRWASLFGGLPIFRDKLDFIGEGIASGVEHAMMRKKDPCQGVIGALMALELLHLAI